MFLMKNNMTLCKEKNYCIDYWQHNINHHLMVQTKNKQTNNLTNKQTIKQTRTTSNKKPVDRKHENEFVF